MSSLCTRGKAHIPGCVIVVAASASVVAQTQQEVPEATVKENWRSSQLCCKAGATADISAPLPCSGSFVSSFSHLLGWWKRPLQHGSPMESWTEDPNTYCDARNKV